MLQLFPLSSASAVVPTSLGVPVGKTRRRSTAIFASTVGLVGATVFTLWGQPQQDQAAATATAALESSAADLLARVPLAFVENRGQWADPARFVARRGSTSAHLAVDAMTYQAVQADAGTGGARRRGVNLRFCFEGACPAVRVQGLGLRAGQLNVFRGADPSAWHTDIAAYERVAYADLWSGVDLEVFFRDGRFEYDVILAPGSELDAVVLRVEGASGPMRLCQDGSLLIDTALGEIRQPKPTTWQQRSTGERVPVDCSYRLLPGERFGFEVPALDPSSRLMIDPGLVWSTYLGGSTQDEATAVAIDVTGAVYVTGMTNSSNFPVTPGVFDTSANGDNDVFVTKLAANGSALVFSTLIGSSGIDVGTAIAIDATGAPTVAGWTSSTGFPTTAGAFDTTYNGGQDGFVARLTTGGGLVYSTFLGGTAFDNALGVAVDAAGAATVVGTTSSQNYPTTTGSFQPAYAAGILSNAFVTRLSLAGDALAWSTYLGPTAEARAVVLDANSEVTVAGWTGSASYPVTAGAYDTSYNGNRDAFATRIAANGAALVYSTFVGGTQADEAYAVGVDATGATVLAGITFSSNFPATAGAADTTYGGSVDGFAAKLTPGGAGLAWSTFVGGSIEDRAFGLALDPTGVTTVVGRTNSADFPTTADAFDTTLNSTTNGSGYDVFVTQLGASNGSLVHSTFLGGSQTDEAYGVAMNATGAATVVGLTASPNYPTTAGAFTPNNTLFNRQAIITRLQLAVVDTVPPVVTITGPVDGAVLGATSVTLSASVVDTSPTTVLSTPAGISASLSAGGGLVSGTVALALEGTNALAVSATDAATNVGGTSIHVIRDTTAPTVTVVAPAEGVVLGESPASLVIQVADATGTTVVFGTSSALLAAGGGQATGDLALVSGPNAIAVTVTDQAGNATVVVRNVVLDLTAPVVTIDTPADGACFGPGEQQIAVAATIDDLTATTVTSMPAGLAGALPPGGGVVTGTVALVEGTNTISVAATDGTSRVGSTSIAVLLDTTAPGVTVDSPANGATVRGAVDFDASATDVAPGTGIARVDLWVDNVLAASQTAPPFHVTFDTSVLADGPHSFTAVAVDGKDNQAAATVSTLVDNTVPAISITTPASTAFVSGTIPFTVVGSDPGSGLAAITMLAGGNAPTIDASTAYPNPVAADVRTGQIDTTTLLDGALLLSAQAVDAAGNETTVAITVTVDNTAPQKTIISPTDGSMVSGVVPIVVGANDPNLASLEILIDNVSIGTSPSSPFTVGFDTRNRVEGPMSITVIATDLASNASTCSITVTVDNQLMVQITPRVLNVPRKATGNHGIVQAHLEGPNVAMLLPPQAHGVELRVPGGSPVPVIPDQVSVHDSDNDGIPEVKFAFDRQAVIASIRAGIAANVIVLQPNHTDVVLTVVSDGVAIASDTVRIKP
ncbi:MAG TPA: Ig-like domain-containing protein [Planctomycetota bacterium]|nr:Ig-like domain-containing protein [Planctomycetota bacterium]